MADANLMKSLYEAGSKGIRDIVLFGRIRCAIKRPKIVGNVEISNGFFAIIDVYGMKCLGTDYFCENGVGDVNNIYFTRGNMVIFIDDKSLIGENVRVHGTSINRGATIKQQFNKSNKYDGVAALCFRMAKSGFVVVPNKVVLLKDREPYVRGTSLEDFIMDIVTNKESNINYPKTLDTISEYHGDDTYEELVFEGNVSGDSIETVGIQNNTDGNANASTDMNENTDVSQVSTNKDGRIDVSKIKLNLQHHLDAPEPSKMLDVFLEEVSDLGNLKKDYVRESLGFISNMMSDSDSDDYINQLVVAEDIRSRFINTIASSYEYVIGDSKYRGKTFVNKFIDGLYSVRWGSSEDTSSESSAKVSDLIEELKKEVSFNPGVLYNKSGIPVLTDAYKSAAHIISVVTGIDLSDLVGNFNSCYRHHSMSLNIWFYSLIMYPYILGMLGSGLNIGDCDRIYYGISKRYNKGILEEENTNIRNDLLFLETLKHADSNNSLVSFSKMSNFSTFYPSIYGKNFKIHGYPSNKEYLECLRVMFNDKIYLELSEVKKLLRNDFLTRERADVLNTRGIIDKIDMKGEDYYILSSDIEKEVFIYNKLIEKGHQTTGISDYQIGNTIKSFEESRGFNLEVLQKDAINLCKYKAAVLSGCAGSGKTTTSDCITECIENYLPNYDIVYGTPTGKACRRLAEVVGGDVRTIHSLFGVGLNSMPYLCSIGNRNSTGNRVYLLDEMAMCSIDLLYEVVRNLSDDDIVYFLGDIKQLPPIGRGVPFYILMHILPCIELGVSKRAAEGSLVNYNVTLINCMSDGAMVDLCYDDKTFIKKECADAMIPKEVVKMFRGFMDGTLTGEKYNEDDIQVITGYQKEDIIFSAPVLNKPLQYMLRGEDTVLFNYNGRDFYENDRVIHIKRNSYEMCRYERTDKYSFKELVTFGVVNGEQGKLVGLVRSDMVNITPFSSAGYKGDPELLEKRERKEDVIRDESKFQSEYLYYAVVKVYDVDLKTDVYVLYRAHLRNRSGEMVFEGGDLGYLDLAYALSTHKMQGSQSKVVICPFGSRCNPRFINRNMLNTMFTRSQGIVGVVGSVDGPDSPINKGRGYVSHYKTLDILNILGN